MTRSGVPPVARAAAFVALLAVLAYGAALAGDFVFDDVHSVSANPAVHDLGNLGRYWTDPGCFSGAAARMYRPALLTSLALNTAISPAAWSLKAGNVLLHAFVSALLLVWLWRLSRRLGAAAAASALFAVHPLASEAVNLISARSELLLALGVLVALTSHLTWQRGGAGRWPLVGLAFGTLLACGSKETGVVLPGLVVAQTLWLRHRLPDAKALRRAALALVPVLVVVVGYLLARRLLLGEATVQLLGRSGEDPASGYGRTLAMQLATMGTLLPRVLWQAAVPLELSLDPAVRFRASFLDPWVLLGWGSLAGLTAAALWPGPSARLRRLGCATAWALALPWIVVPLNMPLAEHRYYGPMLGFAAVGVALAPRLRRAAPAVAWRWALAACCAFGVVASAQRSLLYQDERLLWSAELARNPDSFRAWWGLGTSRRRYGDVGGAVEPLARAHAIYPEHYDALRNYVETLASVDDARAEPFRTLAAAERLAEAGPRDPWVRTLVAQANLQAGRVLGDDAYFEVAERVALSCLEIAEPKGYVYQLAALARHGLGDDEGALAHLEAGIARGLGTVGVRVDRARVLHELGRHADARRELWALQREFPGDPRVLGAVRALAAPPR